MTKLGTAIASAQEKRKTTRKELAVKKLVNLLKNYLTKNAPVQVAPTFKKEQYEKAKKNLLDQTSKAECDCKHEAPKAKATPKSKPVNPTPVENKPVAKNTPKPKPKGK